MHTDLHLLKTSHHSAVSVPTANIPAGRISQTVCAQPWSCQWKAGDRMEPILGKKLFTFSQHDKWWISTNSLGNKLQIFYTECHIPHFLCSRQASGLKLRPILFLDNTINTLLPADLLGSFEHILSCHAASIVHKEWTFYPFHKLTLSYSQSIRIIVRAWLSFLYCADICQEIRSCIFSLWTPYWHFVTYAYV